jgi:hypothetical protein
MTDIFDMGTTVSKDDPYYFLEFEADTEPTPHHQGGVPIRLDGQDEERLSDCVGYVACLEHAACQDWPGFSCRRCPAYEVDPDADTPFIAISLQKLLTHGG